MNQRLTFKILGYLAISPVLACLLPAYAMCWMVYAVCRSREEPTPSVVSGAAIS